MQRVKVELGDRSYDILIGRDLLSDVGMRCRKLGLGRRCAIITDSNVARHYGKETQQALEAAATRHVAEPFAYHGATPGRPEAKPRPGLPAIKPEETRGMAKVTHDAATGKLKVELEPLLDLIARAPEIPQAAQLSRLAATRGAETSQGR